MNTRAVARWIEAWSWAFAALGLLLPYVFHTPAFSVYREALLRWACDPSAPSPGVPAADANLLGLMLGILGGSITGKWIVHAVIARGPLAEGRAWARNLTLRGLVLWFLVDSTASLALGASFNVWMINLLPVALIGIPIFLSWSSFHDGDAPEAATKLSEACFWTSILGAATGVAIAFGTATPLFDPWFRGLEAAHYDGAALGHRPTLLALFFFGPVGGCTIAQFVMLAGLARRESRARRTALAGVVSIGAWFLIDSGYGLAYDGLFNILLVNLPGAAMTLPPWILLLLSLPRRQD